MEQAWPTQRPAGMDSCGAEYRGISTPMNGLYGTASRQRTSCNAMVSMSTSNPDQISAFHYSYPPYNSPTESSLAASTASDDLSATGSGISPAAAAAAYNGSDIRGGTAAHGATPRAYPNTFGNTFLSSPPHHAHMAQHHQQYMGNSAYGSPYGLHNSPYPLDMTGKANLAVISPQPRPINPPLTIA